MKDKERMQLFFGDCREKLKLIPDNSVDFIFADLPKEFLKKRYDAWIPMSELLDEFKRVSKPNTRLIIETKQPRTSEVIVELKDIYDYLWYWKRCVTGGGVTAAKRPMTRMEEFIVCNLNFDPRKPLAYYPQGVVPVDKKKKYRKSKLKDKKRVVSINTGYPNHLLDTFVENKDKNRHHKNEIPVDLNEYFLKTYTKKGDVVLDPFMGSGSMGLACMNTGRKYIGMEWHEVFFKVAVERFEEYFENEKRDD